MDGNWRLAFEISHKSHYHIRCLDLNKHYKNRVGEYFCYEDVWCDVINEAFSTSYEKCRVTSSFLLLVLPSSGKSVVEQR